MLITLDIGLALEMMGCKGKLWDSMGNLGGILSPTTYCIDSSLQTQNIESPDRAIRSIQGKSSKFLAISHQFPQFLKQFMANCESPYSVELAKTHERSSSCKIMVEPVLLMV